MRHARLIVAASLLTIAACESGDDSTETARPPTTPVTAALDRDAAVAAAVDVRADGCGPRVGFGTGALIGDDVVMTAAHVVAGATDIEIIDVEGERSDADVVHFDPDLDLALLLLDRPVGAPIVLRDSEADAGESGLVVRPRWTGGELDLRVGEVDVLRTVNISTTDIYLDREVDRPGFEIEADIDPGDSGALVVLPGGGVGLVWARSNRSKMRAWAIDLPSVVLDPAERAALTTAVDTGPCIRT